MHRNVSQLVKCVEKISSDNKTEKTGEKWRVFIHKD